MSEKPRVLILDIEMAPVLAWVWSLWKQNIGINQINADSYILCWAAKWWGDDAIMSDALPNHKQHYRLNPECDLKVCGTLWKIMDRADIIVAHNGDRFDIPLANARFIRHGMQPPAPAKQVDTFKIAKSAFNLTSNKLDWLGEHLGVGRKVQHDGFDLWVRCMRGDQQSWADMVDYCRGDVVLLEKVWDRIRPWARNHPDMSVYMGDPAGCPACLSKNIQRAGKRRTKAGLYQRYKCADCGKHWASSNNLLTRDERAAMKRSGHDV